MTSSEAGRRLLLVRHGEPDLPPGKKYCLGRTDVPLGPAGRRQAALLGEALRGLSAEVFASPLRRAKETASAISPDFREKPGLEEMDTGEWDGLSFDEIRKKYPREYEARGKDPTCPIPQAEPYAAVQARAMRALKEILESTEGTVILVAHRTVIGAILTALKGEPAERCREYALPCGAYYDLTLSADGRFSDSVTPVLPQDTSKNENIKMAPCGQEMLL